MKFRQFGWLSVAVAFGATMASAGSLTYTCAASVDAAEAGTCAYLNSVVSSMYTGTFSNVNANIYIQQGTTGLGGSDTPLEYVDFSTYASVITSQASGDAVDAGAVAALNSLDAAVYGGDAVVMTSALTSALGFTGVGGTTATGGNCTIGTAGCYNGIITIVTPAYLSSETGGTQSLYWDQQGGSIPANAYDYYSVVEHETDEVLGTISCIGTTTGTLQNNCGVLGANTPSAMDLFRYNSAGNLAANNAYLGLSGAPTGAYFSYNGGVTNGAAGAVFNTLANSEDYADFTNHCQFVQDENGCLGQSFNIAMDGGAEINMLDAVGYNQNATAPEPAALTLFGGGLAFILTARRYRRG